MPNNLTVSVHRGDTMSTSGGYHEYIGGCSVHRGVSWWTWGIPWVHRRDTMSTSEGYHEYIGGCSVHQRDIMTHVGEQLDKILSISIENSDVLNIPWCTHDIPQCTEHPPMYSWYPPDVLMVSLQCTEHPRCTHGIPPMYWTSPDVLMVSLRCTEHPPMYSWYPPDVLMVSPRCTEHPPMYWTHIIQGEHILKLFPWVLLNMWVQFLKKTTCYRPLKNRHFVRVCTEKMMDMNIGKTAREIYIQTIIDESLCWMLSKSIKKKIFLIDLSIEQSTEL